MSEELTEYQVDENVTELESWKVDKYISQVKENNEQIKQLEEIFNKRVEDLRQQFEQKKEQLTQMNHYLLTTLGQFARTQPNLKSTKTQFKLPLLSGDIIIKKPIQKIEKPKKDNEKKIAAIYPELTKTEEIVKLDWTELKKKLVIQDGRIFDQETGEDLTSLIEITEKEEEIIIK